MARDTHLDRRRYHHRRGTNHHHHGDDMLEAEAMNILKEQKEILDADDIEDYDSD